MDRTRRIVALVIAAVGLTFTLQGLGVLPGSFMTGDRLWALIGGAVIFGAFVYAAIPRLRRGR